MSARVTLGTQHARRIDRDLELGPLAALHENARDAAQPVQTRLDS